MTRVATGLPVAFGLGLALTVAIAWPVVRHPATLIFGDEIAGRHFDSYSVIQQFAGNASLGVYSQPVTDLPGRWLARAVGPVAAFNVVVLLAFPLSAAAAYALARYLALSHRAALLAGIVFMLAPFHLAHAAYHPHIAQTQWVPLYLLALFALIDRPSIWRALGLSAAGAALVLSNDYGGFIGAVLTPAAGLAYWWTSPRAARSRQTLAAAAVILVALAGAGFLVINRVARPLLTNPDRFAFPLDDIGWYRARPWAYVVPPVDHPVFGAIASRTFADHGVTLGLVENQVFLGWSTLFLGAVAVIAAARQWHLNPQGRPLLALAATGVTAAYISTGPWSGTCQTGSWAPACVLYHLAPMFRSYARFGVVVALSAALAAGAGAAILARQSKRGQLAAVVLVALLAFEYAPWPWRAHDVLPTAGHRWLAERRMPERILDCFSPSDGDANVAWLMQRDLAFLSDEIQTCQDPALALTLAGLGYTHVIVRRTGPASPLASKAEGLAVAAIFADSLVYRVVARAPPVVTVGRYGFFRLESVGDDFWRWMGARGGWKVVNPARLPRRVSLALQLTAAGAPRTVLISLDGGSRFRVDVGLVQTLVVVGPWSLEPGVHTVTFVASGAPWQPVNAGGSGDTRALTISFRGERWIDDTDDGAR